MLRNIEIKAIRVGSVFKLCFAFGAVIGLIAGIIFLLTGSLAQNIGPQLGITYFESGGPLQVGASILGIVIGSLAYGLLNSIMGIIGALVYNLFAIIVGGIVVKAEE